MARNQLRPIVKLRSTASTGYTYVTRRSRRLICASATRSRGGT
jgi:ribosomal protein L33